MVPQPEAIEVIGDRQWRWLSEQAGRWAQDGLVTADQRDRILSRYTVDRDVAERRGRVVLTTLAVLATSIAILLLIGYNWDAIARPYKVAIIFTSVVAAFGASAVAFARGRMTAGELLAFAGTLLYGNAIWLLAEVFHIGSHYPDGLLWWAIGALAAGALVRSPTIAIEAAALVVMWVVTETGWFAQPNYLFLAVGGSAIALAYHVRSAWTLALAALAVVLWIVVSAGVALDAGRLAVGLGLLTGAGYHAAGRLHAAGSSFARVWRAAGLVVLAAFLGPFMVNELHEPVSSLLMDVAWPVLAVAATLAAAIGVMWTMSRPVGEDAAVRVAAGAAAIWTIWIAASAGTEPPDAIRWLFTIVASAITLSLGVALIRTGMRDDRGWLFAAGVGYALLFMVIRWADLVGNMLWSALFLLASAGALFWMARLWSTRRKVTS